MRRFLLVAALALAGCDMLSPQWKGWIYPNGSDLTKSVALGAFSTVEQCRQSAKTVLANIHLQDEDGEIIAGDYECGYKCEVDDGIGGLNVCEKTER